MKVDVHAHVVPPFVVQEASAAGGYLGLSVADGQLVHPSGYRHPLDPSFFDVDARLAQMDVMELDQSVLSLSPGLFFYDLEVEAAASFARRANDAVAEMAASSDRLMALATVPLQDADASVTELERCVQVLGFRGAQVGTRVGDVGLDDPSLEPFIAACDRLDVPVLLHPYHVPPVADLASYYMANSIGLPVDTTVAAVRLIHSGLLDRYARLRFILVHGGGFLPYQIGRFDHVNAVRPEVRGSIPHSPSHYLRRFWMDTITHGDEALAFLARAIGPDRLVIGTDTPFDMADDAPVARLRRAGLDPDQAGAAALAALHGN